MKRQIYIILPLLIFYISLYSGCTSPTADFERSNINDPFSGNFETGKVDGIQISITIDGSIDIIWTPSESEIDYYIVEKALGDSISFEEIGKVPADSTLFIDNELRVRGKTFYRVSSYLQQESSEDILIEENQASLVFHEFGNFTTEFLDSEQTLRVNFSAGHPLFTHFRIRSDNNITGNLGESILIESGSSENYFIDKLADVKFSPRVYQVEAYIKGDDFEDFVFSIPFTFNPLTTFSPTNFVVNPLNEVDYLLEWDDKAFFIDGYRLIRTVEGYEEEILLPPDISSYMDSILVDFDSLGLNRSTVRNYRIESIAGNTTSSPETSSAFMFIVPPVFIDSFLEFETSSGIQLEWAFNNEQEEGSLAKGFFLERARITDFNRGEFQKIAILDPDLRGYLDTDLNEDESYVYRIRTLVSGYRTEGIQYGFGKVFVKDQEINSSSNQEVSIIEVSPDGSYMAVIQGSEHLNQSIEIYDLSSMQLHSTISLPEDDIISHLKISPDGSSIYFSVPYRKEIWRADFPSGNNEEVVIHNTMFDENENLTMGIRSIDVSSDESYIVGLGGRGHIIKYDLNSGERVWDYKNYTTPSIVIGPNPAISPDDKFVAGSSRELFKLNFDDGSWVEDYQGHFNIFRHTGFSVNSRYLFTSRYRGSSFIYDLESSETYNFHPGPTTPHPFSENIMLTGHFLRDLDENRIIAWLLGFEGWIYSSAFISEDIIVVGLESHIEIWESDQSIKWRSFGKTYVGD